MSAQPGWVGALGTSNPRISQELRTDYARQRNAQGFDTWNLGSGKGFQLVPLARTQLTIVPPPFFDHSAPKQRDGFGDMAFQLKYRLFARPEERGNLLITASLTASVPTGKNGNGSCCALMTPLLGGGKGWGRFNVVSALSGTLPVSNTAGLGRSIASNSVAQYRALGGVGFQVWGMMESNTTFYKGGANDGRVQSFVLPEVALRRIPLAGKLPNGKRTTVTLGVGEQIATTHFHTYNHALIFSMRVPF